MDDVPSRIEHTVLGPETTPDDVRTLLDEASEYGLRACIPPCYLEMASEYTPEVELATVIGFPHGNNTPEVKAQEAVDAVEAGADELDMVVNVGRLKAGEDDAVQEDIEAVVAATTQPVKVIIETPLLTDEEKHRASQLVAEAGADFLKTATGFGGGGATVPDVELMSEYLPVKASGGVGSWADAEAMFEAGADRIGASSGDKIAQEYVDQREE
ncbi:deoxyribose-phosphate aldolase [Halorhabdus sp. CBA1104]|uniref:deoxyribose-phosphate aldolase n=1 Tax=Halorhabdus sp. CBA1104 TaxID=1380432 RepID=UPI0012B206CC|nr:deoxyribose-phosphate aldolase [Halorhabdus sp. CBA1104]QGN06231.1 deoxyribose-phosphate aldolase [Halorhabdus sp. CBA1104]